MEETNKTQARSATTKEEVLVKLQVAQEKKRACLSRLEKSMKETYKKRTGKDAESFFAM